MLLAHEEPERRAMKIDILERRPLRPHRAPESVTRHRLARVRHERERSHRDALAVLQHERAVRVDVGAPVAVGVRERERQRVTVFRRQRVPAVIEQHRVGRRRIDGRIIRRILHQREIPHEHRQRLLTRVRLLTQRPREHAQQIAQRCGLLEGDGPRVGEAVVGEQDPRLQAQQVDEPRISGDEPQKIRRYIRADERIRRRTTRCRQCVEQRPVRRRLAQHDDELARQRRHDPVIHKRQQVRQKRIDIGQLVRRRDDVDRIDERRVLLLEHRRLCLRVVSRALGILVPDLPDLLPQRPELDLLLLERILDVTGRQHHGRNAHQQRPRKQSSPHRTCSE